MSEQNMLLDRKHKSWAIATAVSVGAATAVYAAYPQLSTRPYTGGSWVGLLFGVVAAAAMICAGLLAVRKAIPLVPVGSAQFWLRGHIWIGLASAPLALYHTSFRLGGTLELLLMACFALVLLSGVFGLAMQHLLPRLLKVRVPLETFAEQIPYLCRRSRAEGDFLIAQSCGKLDVEFEPLRNEAFQFAQAEGKLRNGREPDDFIKFLATVYRGAPDNGTAGRRSAQGKGSPPKATLNSRAAEKKQAVSDKLAMAKAAASENASKAEPAVDKKLSVQDKLAKAKAAGVAKAASAKVSAAKPSQASPAGEKGLSIQDKLAQAKAAGAARKAAAAERTSEPGNENPVASSADRVAAAPKPAAKKPAAVKPSAQALLDKLAKKGAASGPAATKPKPKPKQATADEPLPRADELKDFYLEEVRPFLAEDVRTTRRHPFADETTARMRFANQGRVLTDKLLDVHRRLEELCDARRQYLEQGWLRAWLRYWLFVHVPLSGVLFALLAAHVVMALRVVPWEL